MCMAHEYSSECKLSYLSVSELRSHLGECNQSNDVYAYVAIGKYKQMIIECLRINVALILYFF